MNAQMSKRYKVAIVVTSVLLLGTLVFAVSAFIAVRREGICIEALDYARSPWYLAALMTFLFVIDRVIWAYCIVMALALLHFIRRIRGESGRLAFVAHSLLDAVLSVALIFASACQIAFAFFEVYCDPATVTERTTFYFLNTGQTGQLPYSRTALFVFLAQLLILNVPLLFMVFLKSWRTEAEDLTS